MVESRIVQMIGIQTPVAGDIAQTIATDPNTMAEVLVVAVALAVAVATGLAFMVSDFFIVIFLGLALYLRGSKQTFDVTFAFDTSNTSTYYNVPI